MSEQITSDEVPTIFVVDDDPATCHSITWLLEAIGLQCETFASGEAFMQAYDPARPGCVILDVRLPGISGVALQDEFVRRGIVLPVIMLTGYGDVSVAVRCLQRGAVDFLEKPFSDELLIACIERALAQDRDRRARAQGRAAATARVERLTPREREVMAMVVAGKANKVVAYELGISQKTVETHRARVMEKLGVGSLAELVRLDWFAIHGQPSYAMA